MSPAASTARCDLPSGSWAPAGLDGGTLLGEAPKPCSAKELFSAGELYPRACRPRCWWQAEAASCPGWRRVDAATARSCLRGQWLLFAGDSQVRYFIRYLSRWLGLGLRMGPGGTVGGHSHDDASAAGGVGNRSAMHYYDDWDLDAPLNGSSADEVQEEHHPSRLRLSYRFVGPDVGRFERVVRDPHGLETFDEKTYKHHRQQQASSGDRRRRLRTRSSPDLLAVMSSIWTPTCDGLARMARLVGEAPAGRVVSWGLQGSYVGPLDKFAWPERTWACENEAARALAARGRQQGQPLLQLLDLKLLVQMESRPEQFASCPMVRRELYGLPGGDGVHWGVAVQDAWAQLLLHALCPSGAASMKHHDR